MAFSAAACAAWYPNTPWMRHHAATDADTKEPATWTLRKPSIVTSTLPSHDTTHHLPDDPHSAKFRGDHP